MAKKQKTTNEAIIPLILVVIVVILATMYFVGTVKQGAGSPVTKASRSTFLTPGDDVLSLQEDLKYLGTDPVAAEQAELNALQR